MSERKTISESKQIFHKEFPYVIPSIYRKVIDEYLVELNLVSNQKEFVQDGIFSYGLKSSFENFTKGYQPSNHLKEIMISLCKSCNIDFQRMEDYSAAIETINKDCSIIDMLNSNHEEAPSSQKGINIKDLIYKGNYYSRLHSIGLYELTNKTEGNKEKDRENCSKALTKLGFSESRANKDLIQYQANTKKIKEAIELFKIIDNEAKKRKEGN
ncbi:MULTISPECIES: photosystem II biogenesis protein Psp29 [unclassified Prochlorococcus]|uniref:photosystem II biogenesis protein Psp29 n=1 Tax=unclassified Prochlorococcus TaxID=2627481 RepID=UPI000533B632|nr:MULTISPECIES: photosystem II biogenesis protein Psp29 [unclassified Prochlorococcus]KGG15239.1 hypothetical protein EV06_1110 [Prochlorococcus sp. MIT 0602]KGG17516.1 hypothetical protein EV07_0956 [Prochlorococcus sp. MIT 0603]